MTERIVISAAARTPIGKFQGGLAPVAATHLGATAIKAVSYTHLTLPTKIV